MQTKTTERFNEKQEEIANILISLGTGRNVANTLAYIQDKKEMCLSTDIERGANLRQPEISIATKILKEHGWISEWNHKKPGKGRPTKAYKLETPFKDIITQLDEQQKKTTAMAQGKIERLRELARAT